MTPVLLLQSTDVLFSLQKRMKKSVFRHQLLKQPAIYRDPWEHRVGLVAVGVMISPTQIVHRRRILQLHLEEHRFIYHHHLKYRDKATRGNHHSLVTVSKLSIEVRHVLVDMRCKGCAANMGPIFTPLVNE